MSDFWKVEKVNPHHSGIPGHGGGGGGGGGGSGGRGSNNAPPAASSSASDPPVIPPAAPAVEGDSHQASLEGNPLAGVTPCGKHLAHHLPSHPLQVISTWWQQSDEKSRHFLSGHP
eukprot:scaffold122320_cov63-Attheya_sp.AAC.3